MASSSPRRYLVSVFVGLALALSAHAETGVVSATGMGHDTAEAITNLLKTTVGKYFRDEPAALVRNVLQTEILPNASSFVQSYKILEGGRAGAVSLSANVDLAVLHGLFHLTPKNLGETEGAKALVVVRGAKLPDSVLASLKNSASPPDPFAPLAEAARERFIRRNFSEATLTAEDQQAAGMGEDLASPEVLRGLGSKAGARVALAVSARYEMFENENAHAHEERIVLSAIMLDVKEGSVLGKASINVVNPKSRKEQYVADLQRSVMEESKDLFQDVFVAAGRRLAKPEALSDFSVVRVDLPLSVSLVMRFKAILEAVPGVRSVMDYSVRRGAYDFAVRPALTEAALTKALTAAQAPDLTITLAPPATPAPAAEARAPVITVRLAPKESAAPAAAAAQEVKPNANP